MQSRKIWLITAALFAVVVNYQVVRGEEFPASEGGEDIQIDEGRWEISFTPYAWIPDVKAKSTIAGGTVSLDLSFGDIIDNFDVIAFSM